MSQVARLSALVSAISALTLGDVDDVISDSEISQLLGIGRKVSRFAQELSLSDKYANISPERERELRERVGLSAVERAAFFVALPLVRGLSPLEIHECKAGRKINAIKAARERTNLGLADAKNLVEASGFCVPPSYA